MAIGFGNNDRARVVFSLSPRNLRRHGSVYINAVAASVQHDYTMKCNHRTYMNIYIYMYETKTRTARGKSFTVFEELARDKREPFVTPFRYVRPTFASLTSTNFASRHTTQKLFSFFFNHGPVPTKILTTSYQVFDGNANSFLPHCWSLLLISKFRLF